MSAPDPAREGFAAVADAYERGRPGYAPDAVERLVRELGLDASSRLLDLAAGTGQLARLLAPRVGSVVAVEPSDDMRRVLTARVPVARVLAGEAERIPLPTGAVDAVVVGEAFHWFATPATVEEIARVLVPRGGMGLLWNVPLQTVPPIPHDVAADLERLRTAAVPAARRYETGVWRDAFAVTDAFGPLHHAAAEHDHRLDPDALVAQAASWSSVALAPSGQRTALLDRLRATAAAETVTTYRTDLFWTTRR